MKTLKKSWDVLLLVITLTMNLICDWILRVRDSFRGVYDMIPDRVTNKLQDALDVVSETPALAISLVNGGYDHRGYRRISPHQLEGIAHATMGVVYYVHGYHGLVLGHLICLSIYLRMTDQDKPGNSFETVNYH